MSDWKRSTREVIFEQLPSDIKAEIQKHIELHNLGGILSDALMCIETNSEKIKKGLFGSAQSVQQCAMVTPRWLVWAVSDAKSQAALSALLRDVAIQDYADTPFVKLVPDSGIQVHGRFADVSENASAFIGLEENAAGKKFKDQVIGAVQDAKK
jgi:hypothetical protein